MPSALLQAEGAILTVPPPCSRPRAPSCSSRAHSRCSSALLQAEGPIFALSPPCSRPRAPCLLFLRLAPRPGRHLCCPTTLLQPQGPIFAVPPPCSTPRAPSLLFLCLALGRGRHRLALPLTRSRAPVTLEGSHYRHLVPHFSSLPP
uniref:Uncharacterized protein n=1 Tax=Rousettus aegyptiacus TaxID=9407 RepID=A0A7J8F1Z0_ROUAE|nr:hypothetical protein HJG63_012393 [Rousettus aegyptiacus]